MKNVKKISTIASFALIIAILFGVGIYSFFDKDEDISVMENRTLAQKPSFSMKSYFSGDFAKKFEEYYNDQFPGRNTLVKIGHKIDAFYSCLRFGNGEAIIQGGAGIGEGEALTQQEAQSIQSTTTPTTDTTPSETANQKDPLTKPTTPGNVNVNDKGNEQVYSSQYVILLDHRAMEMYTNSYKKMDAYVDTLNSLKKQIPNVKTYCMLAPTSIEFYAPAKYNTGKSKSQFEGIKYIYSKLNNITGVDAYGEIAPHTDEYLYFRTDHHWTARGSYYAYKAFSKTAGFSPVDIDTLKHEELSPFLGSLYRSTQSDDLKNHPDQVEIFYPSAKTTAIYANDAAMKDCHSIKLINTNVSVSNRYLAFLEGDHPIVKITTDAPRKKSILIVKESYANAFVPWLCHNYSEIYVIDPRKVTTNLASFVKNNSIDEVMFINYIFIPTNKTFMEALNKMK